MLKTSTLTYRPDIDGLRAIAVLVVVAFHAFPSMVKGGFVGVDVFFVISGYLISGIVFKGLRENNFSFSEFYVRRIKRIFPALVLVLAACCALGWFAMLANEYAQLGKHVAAAVGFVLNFVFWQEAGYFDKAAVLKPLLHLWSLSIEEQFYVLWPAMLLLAWRRRVNILVLTAAIAALSFSINVALVDSKPVATFFMPHTRAWELMLGSMLAWVERSSRAPRVSWITAPWLREASACAGLGLIAIAALGFSADKAFPGWRALLPTVGAILVIHAGAEAWINRHVLTWPPLVFIGLISYPLYLWHWPLLSFAWLNSIGDPPFFVRTTIVVASVILAWLTYVLMERRIRSSRAAKPAMALAMAAVLMGIAGYSIDQAGGLAFRTASASRSSVTDLDPSFPTKFYRDEVRCEKQESIYRCQPAGSPDPKVVVFGDSHASVLYPGVLHALPAEGVMYLNSCAFPLVGLKVFNKPFNQYCAPETSDRQVEYLAGLKSVDTVLLSFRGPLYLAGVGFGVGSQEREHKFVIEAARPEQQRMPQSRLFSMGVSSAIGVLERAGKNVVLVADFPELGFDVVDCVAGRLFALKFPECRIARSAVEARQGDYRKAVEELRGQHPNIAIFETIPIICDATYCYGIRDHHAIYSDDDHIGPYGSEIVGRALAKFLADRKIVK